MTAPSPQPANYFASIGAVADSELAAATTQIATLTSQLSDATAALTVAQSVETADTTQIAALNAQVANLTAELQALQAAPPPPPPPPPPPQAGTVFVDNDFSGGGSFGQAIAPMTYDGPAGMVVASPDGSGAKVVRFTSPAGGTISDLWYKFGNNAALVANHPNGIFVRFSIGYDAAALANADHNGQFKHWLSRYLDWNSTPGAVNSAGPGGLMGGFGTDFFGEGGVVPGQIVVIDDANTSTIPQSPTGVILQPNVMQKVQYWLSRDPVAKMGHGKMWAWNGTSYDLKVDFSNANMFRDTDGPYDHLYIMLGDSYSRAAGMAYLGAVKIADTFITT